MNDTVTFTMRLDASDLKKLFPGGAAAVSRAQTATGAAGGHAGARGGAGGGGFFGRLFGGAGGQNPDDAAKKQARANATDPTFKSIFKPLAVLTVVNKTLSGLLRNSQIANTYGAAMGKLFGAAIDILLVPFLPFFNLLLVAMTKLMAWLITSGVLEEISKIVGRATGYLEAIAHWIIEVWHAIKNLDFGQLAKLLIGGLGSAIKTAVKDPLGAAMAGGLALVGGSLAMGMLNKLTFGLAGKALGLPFKVAGFGLKMGAKGIGKLFGMGGGAAAEEAAAGGAAAEGGVAAGGGAAAGGAGMLGGLGLGSLALAGGAGLAAGVGTNYLAGKAGIHGTARQALTGAAAGAAGGAVIGSVVPGIGTAVGAIGGGLIGGGIGLAKGLMGGGGGGQQQAGNGVINSNNTINFTQNNTFGSNVNQKQIADDAIKEIERRTGFKLAVRGGH